MSCPFMSRTVNGTKAALVESDMPPLTSTTSESRLREFVDSKGYGQHIQRVKENAFKYAHEVDTFDEAQRTLDIINAKMQTNTLDADSTIKAMESKEAAIVPEKDFFIVHDSAINIELAAGPVDKKAKRLEQYITDSENYKNHLQTIPANLEGEVKRVLQEVLLEAEKIAENSFEIVEQDAKKFKELDLLELDALVGRQNEEYFALLRKQDDEQIRKEEKRIEEFKNRIKRNRLELEMLETAGQRVEAKLFEIKNNPLEREIDRSKINRVLDEQYADQSAQVIIDMNRALNRSI